MSESCCLVSSALEPQVRTLDRSREYVVGRDSTAQIQLVSDRVSHKHARIFWSGKEFVVEDLGSKNGLSVDGAITKRKELHDGELIRVGPFNLRFRVLSGDVEGLLSGASTAQVSGRFSEGELVDFGSVIQLRRLSGALTIQFEGGSGVVTIDKGSVVRAALGELSGIKAAEQILQAASGSFEFRATSQSERGDLSLPFADLLIEVLGSGRRATRTIATEGDVSSDLSALRTRLQAARAELDLANVRSEFGNLFGAVLMVLFVYSIALSLSQQWPADKNIINPVSTAVFSLVMVQLLMRSTYSLKTFGITVENWRHSLLESTLATLPILGLLVLSRVLLHHWLDPNHPFANFEIDTRFLIYPIIAALQEVMLRGAVQTSLQRFFIGKAHTFRAILLTSILFGMFHLHISLVMTFTVIVLSVGWGYLYARQRTLVGVSVSHFLIGMVGFALWGYVIPGWQ